VLACPWQAERDTDRACPSSAVVPFPKIRSGRIRAVRENQTIIRCDVCGLRQRWRQGWPNDFGRLV